MSQLVAEAEAQFLDANLPRGWFADAIAEFDGKLSASTISKTKMGKVKHPDPDLVVWLFKKANENKEKLEPIRRQLSADQ